MEVLTSQTANDRLPLTLHEAYRLLDAGYPLTLCDGKAPVGRGWQSRVWTKADITSAFSRNPHLNVGLQLGPRSGVIDFDPDSPEHEQAFADLFSGHEIQRTPSFPSSRGLHRLFKWDDAFSGLDKAKVTYKGLDIRLGSGNKGLQTVVPPSAGRQWLAGQSIWECDLAPLPGEVIQRILAADTPDTPANQIDAAVDAMLGMEIDDHQDGSKRLISCCCRGVEHSLSDVEIVEAVERVHAQKPFPKRWGRSEIMQRISDAKKMTQPKADLKRAKRADPAGVLVKLALHGDDEFFHGSDGQAYVVTTRHDKRETLLIQEEAYQNQLRIRYTKATSDVIKNDQLRNATQQLKAIATEERPECPVHVRVAECDGKVYIDIGDAKRTIVVVTRDGWELAQTAPARFRRPPSQAPLAIPEKGGTLDALWAVVNMPAAERPLFAGWLTTCLYPHGPYPLATLVGPPGSAKTATARVATDIVDATVVTGAAGAESLVDLMIAAQNRHLIVFDNVSKLEQWLQDGCCRLSTGGALTRRRLYSDGEEVVFRAKRPILITSVGDVITAPDLLDRALRFELPALAQRRPEAELDAEFAAVRGKITGLLMDGVASILRNIGSTCIADLPRLGDFALAATAAEEGLGLLAGSVMEAFRSNHADIHSSLLESDLAKSIREHCSTGFTGTVTELATKIGWSLANADTRILGRELRLLAPALRSASLEIEFTKSSGRRLIRLLPIEGDRAVGPSRAVDSQHSGNYATTVS